jgi:NAD(P)-dependent dehydrogenase (short-subunit alcohol dehydrogenase family)
MKKVIVVTGTSTGFGSLMVKTFHKEGYTVIATMRDVAGKNAAAAAAFSALENTEVVELDVTDEVSVRAAIAGVLAKYGKIDVLVNNAAVYGNGVLEAYSIDQVHKMFDVNVYGTLRVNNEVLPAMRAAKDGLIIHISSGVGRISPPFQAPYNASKFAIEGLVEASYAELISHGVESVLLEPGAFLTELWAKEGINANRDGIVHSYGPETADMKEKISSAFERILTAFKPDPQLVADAALALINTDKGKRALRTPVDPSAQGFDVAYDKVTTEAKANWMAAYGF